MILGLGHIGASLASALSMRGWKVWGWDKSTAAIRYCRKKGWIYHVARLRSAIGSGLVCVVALPETALEDRTVALFLAQLPRGTIVTDVFSSKGQASRRLARMCAARGLRYGWSHPLAGREGKGAASADASVFAGACVLLDAGMPTAVRGELSRFWRIVGCKVEAISTDAHQRKMAAGSHLVHFVAYSMIRAIGGEAAVSPSVLSATRVAKSDPEAWSVIMLSNRDKLAVSVEKLRRELAKALVLLRGGRIRTFRNYLARAQKLRVKMEG